MIVTSVAVATMKFRFGMCDCTVDSKGGEDDFPLVLGILQVCGDAHVRSHVSLGMDWYWRILFVIGQIVCYIHILRTLSQQFSSLN